MDKNRYSFNKKKGLMTALNQENFLFPSKNFSVEVKHTFRPIPEGSDVLMDFVGEHTWCLYVILGKNHPLSDKARNNSCGYDLSLGDNLYHGWHGGCTYYNKQDSYVKIGCDYCHLGDEYFTHEESMPHEVLNDAADLYRFFEDEDVENEE